MNKNPVKLVDLAKKRFGNVPKRPGVYIVCWVKDGRPRPLQRLLGIDDHGILYIGATKSKEGLKGRLKALWNSVRRAFEGRSSSPHTFGPTLIYTNLICKVRKDELAVWYKDYDDSDYVEAQEKRTLYEYTKRYGEPPPLNLQVGRQYLAIIGLGILGKSILAPELDPELKDIITP